MRGKRQRRSLRSRAFWPCRVLTPDDSLHSEIEGVLQAGKAVADRIGPWEGRRPAAPPAGQARISMLTPSGLHFGQAPFETLASDQLGGVVVSATTQLMQSLIAKTKKN